MTWEMQVYLYGAVMGLVCGAAFGMACGYLRGYSVATRDFLNGKCWRVSHNNEESEASE